MTFIKNTNKNTYLLAISLLTFTILLKDTTYIQTIMTFTEGLST